MATQSGSSPTASITDSSTVDEAPRYDAAALRRAHRKVDRRMFFWYCFVYLIMRIHVGNISNAAIMNLEQGTGIKKQLGNLTSTQWAWCLSIFYYPYLAFEPISTLALKRFSPRSWMSRIMITWGAISMCQAATKNYSGMLAARFFLGMAEAGFYPGVMYHLSFWYSPDHLPLRIGFFYASGMFSGTISGLLAYAISFMNGVGGLAGWRWMFLLEGLPAILCAVVTFFLLPNYPETSNFLTEDERAAVIAHHSANSPKMDGETFSWPQIKTLLSDPTFPLFLLTWMTQGIGGWGISFVLPSVIYDLGMTDTAIAQVMTMPPYTLVFVILVSLSFCVQRKWISAFAAALGLGCTQVTCYILLILIKHKVGKYILVMVATAAGQSFFPILWPERIRAVKGTSAAGLAIGITNASCQLMGIVGPQIYNTKFGPTYKVSYSACIGILSCCVLATCATWYAVRRGEKKEGQVESHGGNIEKRQSFDETKDVEKDKGYAV